MKITYQKYALLFIGDNRCIGLKRARTRKGKLQILVGEEWTEPGVNLSRVEVCRRRIATCSGQGSAH